MEEDQRRLQHQKEKLKIKAYHAEIEQHCQLERDAAKERERLVEVERREMLKLGKERVEFRQKLEEEKEAEKRSREARVAAEEKQREKRLEELRQQVMWIIDFLACVISTHESLAREPLLTVAQLNALLRTTACTDSFVVVKVVNIVRVCLNKL